MASWSQRLEASLVICVLKHKTREHRKDSNIRLRSLGLVLILDPTIV